ncbi:MAG TPA: hypothetical protein VK867_12895 [Candidatus Limnocylindrales bacterium]|nr:hypothetical protein [Candidatus Limnocylindrales bacterium]
MTAAPTQRPLRAGLRRLATGLIAYGAIGLILSLIAAVALVYGAGRLSSVAGRVDGQIASVVDTLGRTSAALDDASASASSFAVTIERTPPAVRQTAQTVADLRTDLRSVQAQMSAITILGSSPLSGVSDAFGRMASNLEGLDTRLELIASDLEGNRGALIANADSLGEFGDQLAAVSTELESGSVRDSLDDVLVAALILSVVLVIWMIIPAAGALWLGRWLRAELGGR